MYKVQITKVLTFTRELTRELKRTKTKERGYHGIELTDHSEVDASDVSASLQAVERVGVIVRGCTTLQHCGLQVTWMEL